MGRARPRARAPPSRQKYTRFVWSCVRAAPVALPTSRTFAHAALYVAEPMAGGGATTQGVGSAITAGRARACRGRMGRRDPLPSLLSQTKRDDGSDKLRRLGGQRHRACSIASPHQLRVHTERRPGAPVHASGGRVGGCDIGAVVEGVSQRVPGGETCA